MCPLSDQNSIYLKFTLTLPFSFWELWQTGKTQMHFHTLSSEPVDGFGVHSGPNLHRYFVGMGKKSCLDFGDLHLIC